MTINMERSTPKYRPREHLTRIAVSQEDEPRMKDARCKMTEKRRGKSRARKGLYGQHLPSSFSEENSQISAVGHEPYIPYLNLEITAIAMDRPKEEREARAMGMMMFQASRGFAKSSFLMQLNQNI